MALFAVNIDKRVKVVLVRKIRTNIEGKRWQGIYGPLKEKDTIPLVFPFFPSSISEGKEVNWQAISPPGSNIPVYVWISSGERSVSFSVWLAQEQKKDSVTGSILNALSAMSGAAVRSFDSDYNRDITMIVRWLRECREPEYNDDGLAIAPPVLTLGFMKTDEDDVYKIGFLDFGTVQEGILGPGGVMKKGPMKCIMTTFGVEWVSFFPDGTPRLAQVSLGFAEVREEADEV